MRYAPFLMMLAALSAQVAQGKPWTKPTETDIPPLVTEDLSRDPFRPQLRYTQKLGWANDPNGLVWWNGEWHFFHQHNPFGVKWGNMHWNHAVSRDLVHWTECGDALAPDALGTMFSGSAVTDVEGTAGFGKGAQVLVYTAAGDAFTQCLAFSVDGRKYVKYGGNPILTNQSPGNRDPRVFWHAPSKAWIMALYGTEAGRHVIWIFRSPDLKRWTKASTYVGGEEAKKDKWLYECPGLEEIKIEGEKGGTAWVVWGAADSYAVGTFDGWTFTPAQERIPGYAHAPEALPFYAAQTFTGAPDHRTVWMAWFRLPYRAGASFRHSFSLPQELSLRRTAEGLRLVRRPVRELQALRAGPAVSFEAFSGELAEVDVRGCIVPDGRLALKLRGIPVVYDAKEQTLAVGKTTVPWTCAGGKFAFKFFVDRAGLEVFAADGLQMAPFPDAFPASACTSLEVSEARGVTEASYTAWPLKSIYAPPARRVTRTRAVPSGTRYTLIPIWNRPKGQGPKREVELHADGKPLRLFDLVLGKGEPDWWMTMEMSRYGENGRSFLFVTPNVPEDEDDLLAHLRFSDTPAPAPPDLYDEPQRPQLKFSAKQGWMNDPNGLAYVDGRWRLMYQHNPYSIWFGNCYWGYADSPDLLHWTDHGEVLCPTAPYRNIISGCGVVDVENTAGFGKDMHILLVKYGPGLCAWTTPDGLNYRYLDGNPLSRAVPGCDPKVIWYPHGRKWICLTHGVEDNTYVIYFCSSSDLKAWTLESRFYGDHTSKGRQRYMHECPGIEELKIRGERGSAWILWGANAVSAIGRFDGHVFTPEAERVPTYQQDPAIKASGPWYAAQTFQNAPDGRVVLVPWLKSHIMFSLNAKTSFNQMLGIPQELELVRTPEGLRLSRRPVKEMETLRTGPAVALARFEGELAEIHVSCHPGPDSRIDWNFRGVPFSWEARTQMLVMGAHGPTPVQRVKWPLVNGLLAFRLYLDRLGFEVFSPDGLLSAPFPCAHPDPACRRISAKVSGNVTDCDFTAYPLKSIWR